MPDHADAKLWDSSAVSSAFVRLSCRYGPLARDRRMCVSADGCAVRCGASAIDSPNWASPVGSDGRGDQMWPQKTLSSPYHVPRAAGGTEVDSHEPPRETHAGGESTSERAGAGNITHTLLHQYTRSHLEPRARLRDRPASLSYRGERSAEGRQANTWL